jgi:hypothetical protein
MPKEMLLVMMSECAGPDQAARLTAAHQPDRSIEGRKIGRILGAAFR